MIVRKLELGPFASNCYVVGAESGKEGMVIDPGAMGEQIVTQIKALGLDIQVIVLTHGHMDHTGALAEVHQATGAQIAIHAEDAPFLQAGHPMMRAFNPVRRELPQPDRLLKDGDIIDIGELHFRVLHTPGHTPGGICLQEEGIVFTGDTLFQFSVGRTDFPGGSHELLIAGIRSKLMPLPDSTIVCPGHGPDSTIGIERRANPFL